VFCDFSKTFEVVQQEDVKTWRFYRISVIMEYDKKPSWVPPLIVFGHLWRLGEWVYEKCSKEDSNKAS